MESAASSTDRAPLAQRKKELCRMLISSTRQKYAENVEDNYIAPFSPSPMPLINSVLDELNLSSEDVVLDLGCGDGRWLIAACKRSGCRGLGVEIDEKLVESSNKEIQSKNMSDRVSVVVGDLANTDISSASVVVVYAFAKSCEWLANMLEKQCPNKARVVSVGFRFRDWTPAWSSRVSGLPVYIYTGEGRGV